jgi:hypothetical protein
MSEASKWKQAWLKENLQEVWDKEVWPSSSPDYSLLGFFVCGLPALKVSAKSHNKMEDRIQKMRVLMGSLDWDTVAKAC